MAPFMPIKEKGQFCGVGIYGDTVDPCCIGSGAGTDRSIIVNRYAPPGMGLPSLASVTLPVMVLCWKASTLTDRYISKGIE